jgi:AcrR family transcriptional regulator
VSIRRGAFAAAAAELADEVGVGMVSVTALCEVAGASRASFYEAFGGGEECLRYTAARGHELLFGGVEAATAEEGAWEERVEAALAALFAGAFAAPALARFALVHSRALRLEARAPDPESGVAALAALLASRRGPGAPVGPREEYVACLHLGLLTRRLLEGGRASIGRLPRELEGWALASLDRAMPPKPAGSPL